MKYFALFILIFSIPVLAHAADQVVLTNGDRYTGTIMKADGETLILKTDSAGELTIEMKGIDSFSSGSAMYVTTSDGKTQSGILKYSSAGYELRLEDGTVVPIPAATVSVVRSKDTYDAEVMKYEMAGVFDLWSGFVEAGLSLSQGNSDTFNLAIGANGTRTALTNKTTLYFASLYSESDVAGVSETTANALRGGARYERNITDRLSAFAFNDLEHDEFQNLDLRWVLGGGLGYYLAKSDRTQFQVFGGASYNHENFSDDITRNSGELLTGEQLDYKLSDRVTLTERFVIFLNLSESGEFRMNFDTSMLTKINDRFGWHLTFSDRYLSNPVGDAEENDLLLSTGLRFSF